MAGRPLHGCGRIGNDHGPASESLACVAYIWTPNSHEANKLRNALKPILQAIDPEFNLLLIGDYYSVNGNLDSELILNHLQRKEEELHKTTNSAHLSKLKTPSLAFVLMLQEKHPFQSAVLNEKFRLTVEISPQDRTFQYKGTEN